jgi:hypothetical protein
LKEKAINDGMKPFSLLPNDGFMFFKLKMNGKQLLKCTYLKTLMLGFRGYEAVCFTLEEVSMWHPRT